MRPLYQAEARADIRCNFISRLAALGLSDPARAAFRFCSIAR
jgi:hypothetical protein